MSELPQGWALATLGEVIIPGGLFDGPFGSSLKTEDYTDHGVRVIRLENVANLRFVADKHAYISHEKYAQLLRHTVGEGDIVFGSFVESSTRVCMLPKLETPAIAKADCFTIRADQAIVLPQFLLFQLGSDRIRRQFQQDIHGATRPRVSLRDIRDCIIALPPLAEQKRIVAKIDELTAQSRRAKEELDAIPALLDQLRQSILAAAFRGDLTADWRAQNPDVEPAEQLLSRIRAERRIKWEDIQSLRPSAQRRGKYLEPERSHAFGMYEIPKSWAWASWHEIGFSQNGRPFPSTAYQDQGVRLLRPGNLHVSGEVEWAEGNTKFLPEHYADENADLVCGPDQLIMNLTAQSLKDEFLGRVCVTGEGSALLNQRLARLVPVAMSSRLTLWLFKSSLVRSYIDGLNSGSLIQHMFTSQVDQFLVPVMPAAEQEQMLRLLEGAMWEIDEIRTQVESAQAQLATLNQSILAKAFRGELVPQDPTDEPASILLERIRAARASATPTAKPKRTRTPAPQPSQHQLELPTPTPTAAPTPAPKAAPRPRAALDAATLDAAIDSALWLRGPLEKDAAIRTIAEHLREAGLVEFQRLRSGSGLHAQIDDAIESAIAAGRLDRPKFGYVRACKADAQAYSSDDWRAVLVASLGPEPTLREDAIRSAAEWAREHTGLAFVRLRSDGHIVEGLRSAINSAIRRNEVVRHDAKRISRSPGA
jgi:type I restriction enzyme S subunit